MTDQEKKKKKEVQKKRRFPVSSQLIFIFFSCFVFSGGDFAHLHRCLTGDLTGTERGTESWMEGGEKKKKEKKGR